MKLQMLEQQLRFLKTQQERGLDEILDVLNEFIEKLDSYQNDAADEDEQERLAYIRSMFITKIEEIKHYFNRDLAFLDDQCVALQKAQELKDPVAKAEIEKALLEDFGEVKDNNEFEQEVLKEVEESKQEFVDFIDDFSAVLEEGSLEELEALISEMGVNGDEEDGCCSEDELPENLSDEDISVLESAFKDFNKPFMGLEEEDEEK